MLLTPAKFRKAVAVLTLALAVPTMRAQFSSSIEGTVTDPTRAVVPNATVTLKNVQTSIQATVQTSTSGYYRFSSLPASRFTLTISAAGFKTTEQSEFTVQVAEIKTVNVTLELGTQATIVSVTAEPPPIETSEGRVSGVIEPQKLADLPLAGRNFYGLVVLTPGVTGLPSGGSQAYAQATADVFTPEYGVNLNANGLRAEQNAFTVDSGSVTSMVRHGVTNVIPNAKAVQELRISVNNFDAQNGGSAGALVSVITKQGTNDWHGSAAYFHTNNHLQARNEFQPVVPLFRRNEGTWGLGGPIVKNHTFVFGSMDFLRSGVAPGTNTTVFTPAFINWMQQNQPNKISTYLLKTFPAQVTPTSNFRTAQSLAGQGCGSGGFVSTAVGSLPCDLQVIGVGGFAATIPRNGLQWNARVDHVFRESDRLYGNIYRTYLDQTVNQSVYSAFRLPQHQYTMQINLNETHTFSPTLLNEFSSGYVRTFGYNPCSPNCQIPIISITGVAGFGGGGPTLFAQNNFEWRDVLSWNHGGHSFKAGGSVARLQSNFDPTLGYQRPTYNFTTNVFDFANDNPFSESGIGFNPVTGSPYVVAVAERQTLVGVFAQDDWKIKPNFTLTLGLRWETFGKIPEATKVTNVVFQGGNDFSSRIANAKTDIVPTIYSTANLNNWGPRLSLAWDPTKQGKMSIRAGAGIFYDVHASQVYGGSHFNPPLFALVTASPQTAPVLPVYGLGSPAPPYNFPRSAALTPGLDSKNGLLFGKAGVTWVDPNSRDSYSENWFFGIQRSLRKDWVVEADYIGSGGHRLYANFNVNRVAGDLIQHNGVFNGLNTSYGSIAYVQSVFNSSFNGGTLSLKKRQSHGVIFEAAYTFGKALDYASSFGGNLPIADINNYRLQRGRADFNVGQKLAFTAVWQLPAPGGSSALMKNMFGGWQLGSVTILQDGTPFRVFCSTPFVPVRDAGGKIIGNNGCDYNADGFNNDVPNAPVFGNKLGSLSRSNYLTGLFTASQFPAPPLGQEGNLGRNVFNGPGFANTDLSLYKTAKIPWFLGKEGATLQFRAEAFNLFNRVNLTQVNADMANPTLFGKSTSTFGARDIQFGLRLAF